MPTVLLVAGILVLLVMATVSQRSGRRRPVDTSGSSDGGAGWSDASSDAPSDCADGGDGCDAGGGDGGGGDGGDAGD